MLKDTEVAVRCCTPVGISVFPSGLAGEGTLQARRHFPYDRNVQLVVRKYRHF